MNIVNNTQPPADEGNDMSEDMAKTHAPEVQESDDTTVQDSMALTKADLLLGLYKEPFKPILGIHPVMPKPPWEPLSVASGADMMTIDNAMDLEEVVLHNCAIKYESGFTKDLERRIRIGDLDALYAKHPKAPRTIRFRCQKSNTPIVNLITNGKLFEFGDRKFAVGPLSYKGNNCVECEMELIQVAKIIEDEHDTMAA